jgi:hypothetical protein
MIHYLMAWRTNAELAGLGIRNSIPSAGPTLWGRTRDYGVNMVMLSCLPRDRFRSGGPGMDHCQDRNQKY